MEGAQVREGEVSVIPYKWKIPEMRSDPNISFVEIEAT